MIRALLIFFILFIFIFSKHTLSTEQYTRDQVKERIEALSKQPSSIPPKEIVKELQTLSKISAENHWLKNEILANSLLAEVLVALENFSEAKPLVDKYLPFAQMRQMKVEEIRLKLAQLNIETVNGYSETIENLVNELLVDAKSIAETMDAAAIYMGVGKVWYVYGQYTKSIINYEKAYKIYEAKKNKVFMGFGLNALANVNVKLKDYDTAIMFLKDALAISKELSHDFSSSIILYNLANAYTARKSFDLAEEALLESLAISESIDDTIGAALSQKAIANIYLQEGYYKKALALFEKTIGVLKDTGNNRALIKAYFGQIDCFIALKQFNRARKTLDLAFKLLELINDSKFYIDYSKRDAELAYLFGNYREAYKQQLHYSKLADKRHQEEKDQDINKLRIQFNVELSEKINRVLEKENELNALKITQQESEKKYWLMIVALSLVTMIIIGVFLFVQTRMRGRFEQMALHDALTNAPNRRAIVEYAESLFNKAKNSELRLTIGLIDLDFFKQINDSYGHDVGDEVLKSFSDACQSSLRQQDHFGRYGGEEWLIVLTNTSSQQIEAIFQRLHKSLNDHEIIGLPDNHQINFSVGVAAYHDERGSSLEQLIKEADSNLYQAKDQGRNRVVFQSDTYSIIGQLA